MSACLVQRDWAVITAEGQDCRSWLNGLVTCDLAALAPGTGTWGLVLGRTGKIQSFVVVVAEASRLWLGVERGTAEGIRRFLDERLIMEDVELAQPATPHTWLSVHGPNASGAARDLGLGDNVPIAELAWTEHGDAAFVVPEADAARILDATRDAGAADGADFELLRVRSGFPWFGMDYDSGDNPHDASLERRAVSWTKGCYVGQEVVFMQDARGKRKRRLALLEFRGPLPAVGAVVTDVAGETLGNVTSVAKDGDQGWAIARLLADRSEVGGMVTIGALTAAIVAPRFP